MTKSEIIQRLREGWRVYSGWLNQEVILHNGELMSSGPIEPERCFLYGRREEEPALVVPLERSDKMYFSEHIFQLAQGEMVCQVYQSANRTHLFLDVYGHETIPDGQYVGSLADALKALLTVEDSVELVEG